MFENDVFILVVKLCLCADLRILCLNNSNILQLLCGYPPFYGDSDTEIFDSVRTGKFDFPSPEWDDISQEAKDFVKFLLQKDPKMR